MIITALVIGASMRIVGILLVSSLMTIPVAAAMQLAKSFKGAMIYSIVFGELLLLLDLFPHIILILPREEQLSLRHYYSISSFLLGRKYREGAMPMQ